MKRNAKKNISILLSLCMFIGLMTISQSASTAATDDYAFSSQVFQNFNDFNGIDEMRNDGYAAGGTSGFAEYSLSDEYSYGDDGGLSFKYWSIEAGKDNTTSFSLYTPEINDSAKKSLIVPEGATGFNFWLLNESETGGDFTIGITPEIDGLNRNDSKYRVQRKILSGDARMWTQYTIRFDEFGYKQGNYVTDNGSMSNGITKFAPRSLWDKVVGLQMRIGETVREGTTFYLDNIEWIFDNVIEDFENITLGTGTDQINVSTDKYATGNSPAGTVAEIVDFSYAEINSADSFRSDRGKSLKINLGTVTNEVSESGYTLNTLNPRILIKIPLDNINLVGKKLKFYVRYENDNPNASGTLDVRSFIEDTAGTKFRMTRGGHSLDITSGDEPAKEHAAVVGTEYSSFKANSSFQNDAITAANLKVDQLTSSSQMLIYISPRIRSSGGTVYIDSITVTDPLDMPVLDDAVARADKVSAVDGYTPSDDLGTALTKARDFYNKSIADATMAEFDGANAPLWNQLNNLALDGLPNILLKYEDGVKKAVTLASLNVSEDELSIINLLDLKNKLIK